MFKVGAPPFGTADYPQVVANLLKALSDSDKIARRAAAFSLGVLHTEPSRTVPALALAAVCDLDAAVKTAAVEGLRQFDIETRREASGSFWPMIAGMV